MYLYSRTNILHPSCKLIHRVQEDSFGLKLSWVQKLTKWHWIQSKQGMNSPVTQNGQKPKCKLPEPACHMIRFIWPERVTVRAYISLIDGICKCEDNIGQWLCIGLSAKNNCHWWVQPHDAQGWFNVSSLSVATIAGCENCECSSPFFGSGLGHLLVTDKGCPGPLRGVCENPFHLRRHIKKIKVHSRSGLCTRLPLLFACRTFHGLPERR